MVLANGVEPFKNGVWNRLNNRSDKPTNKTRHIVIFSGVVNWTVIILLIAVCVLKNGA